MDALERVTTQCPYCGNMIELTVERSIAKQSYVDECQVCCRTIQMEVEADEENAELSVIVHREDD